MNGKPIRRWCKRGKENGGRLEALIPVGTPPGTIRKSNIPQKIIDWVEELRRSIQDWENKTSFRGIFHETGLKRVSEATIGHIIKRHKLLPEGRTEIS